MKKNSKRAAACILSAILAASFLGSCAQETPSGTESSGQAGNVSQSGETGSNFNETGLPIVNEPVSFRVMIPQAPNSKKSIMERPIFDKLQEETNVVMEWEEIANSAWQEKVNIAINSGDLPDAILAGSIDASVMSESIAAGLVVSWDEYMQYSPQLEKMYEIYPIAKKATEYQGDGKHYYYPGIIPKEEAECRAPLFINTQWLEKLNLEVPTTTEEFYNVLVAFKTQDPNGNGQADEIPMLANNTFFGFSLLDFLGPWDMMGIKNPAATTIRDGKLDFNPVNPNFRTAMEYFHKLYAEGLISAECLTMDGKTSQALCAQDPPVVGASIDWDNGYYANNRDQYEAIPPLKGPTGAQKWTYNDVVQVQNSMIIFTSCKQPEVLVRWMDNANSGTNILSIYAGIQGVGWDIDEETKEWYTLDQQLKEAGESFDTHRVTEGIQNAFGSVMVSGYTYRDNEYSQKYKKNLWTEMYRPYLYTEYFPASVSIEIPSDESKEIALLWTELETYINSFVADAVMNGIDDAKWEAHIKQCESLQYEKIVAYHQARYDALMSDD